MALRFLLYIIKGSKTLSEYVFFTNRIKSNIEIGFSLEEAIDETVKHCLNFGISEDFLEKYRSEMVSILATESDMDKALKAVLLDGIEIGIEQSIEQGIE